MRYFHARWGEPMDANRFGEALGVANSVDQPLCLVLDGFVGDPRSATPDDLGGTCTRRHLERASAVLLRGDGHPDYFFKNREGPCGFVSPDSEETHG